jgi:hypothetical protein
VRVVILLDRSFARRERNLLSRLEIGLADEGVRVIHAVPRSILEPESFGLYSSAIGYDDRGFPTTNSHRTRQLLEAISDLIGSDPAAGVDIVHCFGAGHERLAIELAAALDAPALIEVWQSASFPRAADALRRAPARTSLVFPDQSLHRAMLKLAPGARALDAPWGVHAADEPAAHPDPAREAPAVGLLADGSRPDLLDAALQGLARAAVDLPELLIFVDTERARSPRLWQSARRHGLLDRLSIVPGVEARREPILRLDALLIPEPSGRLRSIILDAMARGLPVIATPDPTLSILSNPAIATLIPNAAPDSWANALRHMLVDSAPRQTITRAASEFIRTERTASAHVAAVLKAYEQAIAWRKRPVRVTAS